VNRRSFLRTLAASGVALSLPGVLAACGGDSAPATTTTDEAKRSTRELRVSTNVFPVSIDPDVGFTSFSLMGVGAGEALMRVTPDMQLVPWLAEKLTQVDATTWRVTIREDATFWDGSQVDAEAVKASFERTMEKLGGAVSFAFPTGTRFVAKGRELDITTPTPSGAMPSNLSIFYLIIKKFQPNGSVLMTGPYTIRDFVDQQSLTLQAYEGHRGAPTRTPTIRLLRVTDVNTRVLALQAGDTDLAFALLPSQVPQLKAAGLKVESFLFGRLNGIILNNTRPPLDDVAVRRAIALGIDRTSLVAGVLEGQGKPAYGLATKDWGIESAVDTQRFDRAAANTTLDNAGWARGTDGIRSKSGNRLTFTLTFYKSRPELEPFAVVVRDQLRQIGIETSIEESLDINRTVAENTFDATLYSYTVTPSGDLNRGLAQLFVPGSSNNNRYSNPRVNDLYDEYNGTSEPGKRSQLVREIQELIGQDAPFVYLAFPNQIVAMSPKVSGYTPHLLENYQIDGKLYVAD
jgi:peptide/nickel transport system substrate-binding protein